MPVLVLMLISGALLAGAEKYVCDQPQNGRPCSFPNSQLQKAFDSAKPGDTLYLQAGHTYLGAFVFRTPGTKEQPITVTSSRTRWLPGPTSRVTPSDLPNMPMLVTNVQNDAALSGNLDAQKNPPSHWHFIGIGFGVKTPNQFDNAIVHTAGMGVNGWTIANEQQLPDGLVFDRVYIAGPLDDSLIIQNGIRLNGKNTVFKNSFIQPIYCRGIECHGLVTQTHPGTMEVTNNFIAAASIPVFSGGTKPDFEGAVQKDLTMRFNYLYRPLKWWPNPNNPDRKYFLENGSKGTCTKNLIEFKGLDGGLIEYNVHENIWMDNFCMGQYAGFTATPRQNYWESPAAGGSWGLSLGMGSLTTSGDTFRWTSNPKQMAPGQNVCGIVKGVHDCRKISEVDNVAKIGKVTAPFTHTVTSLSTWLWVTDDTPMLRNVTLQNSIFRNAAQGINLLARDKGTATPGSDAGRIVNLAIRNNLFQNKLPGLRNSPAIRIHTQEQAFTLEPSIGGRDIVIEHNTFDWKDPSNNVLYFAADGIQTISRIQNLVIRSNVFPEPVIQTDGNIYALGASSRGFNDMTIMEAFAAGNSKFTHNYMPNVSTNKKCGSGMDCSENTDSKKKISKRAHDKTDIGVDYAKLPQIQNLDVKKTPTALFLEFDLSAPIAKHPCVLEISADENLNSYLGPYRPIDALNPAYFKQATSSAKATLTGNHVTWQIPTSGTTKGDDGANHSLDLRAPEYWGRLMCYADTAVFSFKP